MTEQEIMVARNGIKIAMSEDKLALPAAGMWQPWETAPRDGSAILVKYVTDGRCRKLPDIIFYDDIKNIWTTEAGHSPFKTFLPTHWAPINLPEDTP